ANARRVQREPDRLAGTGRAAPHMDVLEVDRETEPRPCRPDRDVVALRRGPGDRQILGAVVREAEVERDPEHQDPERALQQPAAGGTQPLGRYRQHRYLSFPSLLSGVLPSVFFLPLSSFKRSKAVAVNSTSILSASEYRRLMDRCVTMMSRGPVSTRR